MADMPMGQPIPDDPTDPVGGDFHPDLTDEQIEAALRGETLPEKPAEDDYAPDPNAPKVDDPKEPEKVPDTPEAEPEPQTPEDRLAALESQVRMERLERERAEAVAERERFLHSRNAGEVGHLKQLLAQRRAEGESDYSVSDVSATQPELTEIRTELNALKIERVQQATAEEVMNFQRAFPDALTDEAALTEIVARKMPDYQEFLQGTDPKLARTIVRSLLKESYAELRIEKEQAAKATATTQSFDQAAKLRARKIAAAPASTTRSAQQRARARTIDDLTDAELEALTDEHIQRSV